MASPSTAHQRALRESPMRCSVASLAGSSHEPSSRTSKVPAPASSRRQPNPRPNRCPAAPPASAAEHFGASGEFGLGLGHHVRSVPLRVYRRSPRTPTPRSSHHSRADARPAIISGMSSKATRTMVSSPGTNAASRLELATCAPRVDEGHRRRGGAWRERSDAGEAVRPRAEDCRVGRWAKCLLEKVLRASVLPSTNRIEAKVQADPLPRSSAAS